MGLKLRPMLTRELQETALPGAALGKKNTEKNSFMFKARKKIEENHFSLESCVGWPALTDPQASVGLGFGLVGCFYLFFQTYLALLMSESPEFHMDTYCTEHSSLQRGQVHSCADGTKGKDGSLLGWSQKVTLGEEQHGMEAGG